MPNRQTSNNAMAFLIKGGCVLGQPWASLIQKRFRLAGVGSGDSLHYADQVDAAEIGDDAYQFTLDGDENIFSLPYNLAPDMIYYWRVDARRGDDVYKGDVWSFGAI